ncbi:PIPO [Shallot yellow stripe virus]|uniref:PIPO n=1 Tax=Shallot yellow stripe virus TaxID=62059 RepID=UPI00026512FA|nr:PIPO [Shallot yellow stripe virus]
MFRHNISRLFARLKFVSEIGMRVAQFKIQLSYAQLRSKRRTIDVHNDCKRLLSAVFKCNSELCETACSKLIFGSNKDC